MSSGQSPDVAQPTAGAPLSPDVPTQSGAPSGGRHERLEVIASETFALQGDVHRLVTFLNQCLKGKDLIFGLTRVEDGVYRLTVYRG
ncbi:MAG: hypothetical protein BAA04_07540 [Firmicutes bacterium ZCTH02-B6]|nr:MAG: hypothetical protein BAA04_07540 [Firmicutes bacterium ZCTH02-B6]